MICVLLAVKIAIFAVILGKHKQLQLPMILNLVKSILISPREGWNNVSRLGQKSIPIGLYMLFCLVLLAGILSIIGVNTNENGSTILATRYFGYISLKWIVCIPLTSWTLTRLVKAYKGSLSFREILLIVTFCSSFLVIASSLSYIFPTAKIVFQALSAIGIVYYYFALTKISGLPPQRTPGFLLISILVYAVIIFFVDLTLIIAFSIPINL